MSILDTINSPDDVKSLKKDELDQLCSEIRQEIITTTSANGGHLASNLGIVELTVALHRVFSLPKDKIIFDVGHQAYTHKLLTGRRADFHTLRTGGGISGFTNIDESEYDTMTAGHSGSSLSYAVGIASAEKLNGGDAYTVAVIGDGSFTNGMIYEAMNNASEKGLRLIIVLNDNEMSISRNVGSISQYFQQIRSSERYFSFKTRWKRRFDGMPVLGAPLLAISTGIKNITKRIVLRRNLFENLGLEYFGPVRGSDIEALESVLKEAKAKKSPVVVHVNTVKGAGYEPAERYPDKYHSASPFSISDGAATAQQTSSAATFTKVFSEYIVTKAKADEKICAITAAMADGTGLTSFRNDFPARFFDSGISEEHAITFSGGLAYSHMKPVVCIYSTFIQRVFDQIWHDVALQRGRVTIVISHAGLVPDDGVTHQGIYDVSLLSPVPGITIYSPDTYDDMRSALDISLGNGDTGLTVIRYPKGREAVYDRSGFDSFSCGYIKHGKGKTLVVTYGRITQNVSAAVNSCGADDITLCVYEKIAPLDTDCIADDILKAERIIFIEEGIRTGGIGEQFAALVSDRYGKSVHVHAIDQGFLPHDTTENLMKLTHLDAESITHIINNNARMATEC